MWGASRRSGDSRSGVQAGLIPWQGGKSLTWNVTVVSTLADSYLHSTSRSAGSAAEAASVRKESKYLTLTSDLIFQPIAMETHGPLNASALNFLSEVGRRLSCLRRFSRDLVSVSATFGYCPALQLCSHFGFFLHHRRRPGPLATSDICF